VLQQLGGDDSFSEHPAGAHIARLRRFRCSSYNPCKTGDFFPPSYHRSFSKNSTEIHHCSLGYLWRGGNIPPSSKRLFAENRSLSLFHRAAYAPNRAQHNPQMVYLSKYSHTFAKLEFCEVHGSELVAPRQSEGLPPIVYTTVWFQENL
jgi:hypothetical protein